MFRTLRAMAIVFGLMYLMPLQAEDITKEQIKGSMVLALETTSARMARIAASYIYRGTVEPVEEVLRQFDAVTGDNVKALAEQFITDDKISLTCLGPVRDVDRPAI